MKPNNYSGRGTVSFSNGESYEVDVHLSFHSSGGFVSGDGRLESDQAFSIGMNDSGATLIYGGQKIKIVVNKTHIDECHFLTSGPPSAA
ncbi:hypothetical protein IQ03_03750 [Gemmobacter caeni]|uniref:Uncharacterized protein n=1 Tax=Gemmobacter caeni TaxID=589035 RepID=A0A2T6AR68_9RHOB|nr:hypothetical protein [Gemmobacter caeni]PTX46319.1 hypothetical protein C8N34_1177 [Gemmobacter caeni]TWI95151.1 hypothetical protein IQ03_03750 [Gemmobacter caeni]